MEKALVIALLEKYFQAETTIAEEQTLAAYFQGDEVDPGLEGYRDLFSYFHEEAQVSAGPDFGDRILQRLGLPLDAPVVPLAREPFRLGVAAAAAAIVIIVAGLFLMEPPVQPGMLADNRIAAQTMRTDRTHIIDTYDDPQQALAAVRHALLIASRNLNQGRREITGAHK